MPVLEVLDNTVRRLLDLLATRFHATFSSQEAQALRARRQEFDQGQGCVAETTSRSNVKKTEIAHGP